MSAKKNRRMFYCRKICSDLEDDPPLRRTHVKIVSRADQRPESWLLQRQRQKPSAVKLLAGEVVGERYALQPMTRHSPSCRRILSLFASHGLRKDDSDRLSSCSPASNNLVDLSGPWHGVMAECMKRRRADQCLRWASREHLLLRVHGGVCK